MLDRDPPAEPDEHAPPLAHWLYFLPGEKQSELGEDGHPCRGAFLPPVELPRRMWAGSRVEFLKPIPLGVTITRRSTISSIARKTGVTGDLVFVGVKHEISHAGQVRLREHQDLVYRGHERTPPAAVASLLCGQATTIADDVRADSRLLFRFSALTFNSHRIHYDQDYACEYEGYRERVVQAPLTATLLLDLWRRTNPGLHPATFAFRAVAPLFCGERIRLLLCGDSKLSRLEALNPEGRLAMRAEVSAE